MLSIEFRYMLQNPCYSKQIKLMNYQINYPCTVLLVQIYTRKRKEIGEAPKSITTNTGVNGTGMRSQQNEYDYAAKEHQIDDIGLESNSDSEDSGGDFEQYDKRRKEHKRQRQDELGVQLADAAEASMMTPNQSILQQSPSAGPMEDDGELATEVNSDGETIAEDPDAVTTQDGRSLAELKRERERQNANRNSGTDIAPAERRRLQQEMIQAQRLEEERLMEERIRLEQEKDPDALEEDIRKQVLMER